MLLCESPNPPWPTLRKSGASSMPGPLGIAVGAARGLRRRRPAQPRPAERPPRDTAVFLTRQAAPRRERGSGPAQTLGGVLEERVGDRRHEEREEQAERLAADDDDGDGAPLLGPGTGADPEGQHARDERER